MLEESCVARRGEGFQIYFIGSNAHVFSWEGHNLLGAIERRGIFDYLVVFGCTNGINLGLWKSDFLSLSL